MPTMVRSLPVSVFLLWSCATFTRRHQPFDVAYIDRTRVLKSGFLSEAPVPITAFSSPRSAGGAPTFLRKATWWPGYENPGGPYIQRDGMTNPDNFTDHRRSLMRLSVTSARALRGLEADRGDRSRDRPAKRLRMVSG